MSNTWKIETREEISLRYLTEALWFLKSAKATFAPSTTNSNADFFMEKVTNFLNETEKK